MNTSIANISSMASSEVRGEFVTLGGERYYAIRDVDKMPPFFISVVSDSDHWMFIASNGGLTAGRVSPETALFPYITVDRLYESTAHTGSKLCCVSKLRASAMTGSRLTPSTMAIM